MYRHLVMWKMKESANGMTREQLAIEVKRRLESLPAKERVADSEWSQLCAAMSGSLDHEGEDAGRLPEGNIPF